VKADGSKVVYSDIFPNTKIKRGDGAMNLWSLEGGYNNYLATSPTGTATGFGCTLMMIDDLIKSALEAMNAETLEKHWSWFTDTMLSRLEEGGKIIIIMTRWATGDLAGRALEHYKAQGANIRHITMKALQDDGTMLCDEILSRRSYNAKIKAMGLDVASANYQQEPIDIKGKLYTSFKTYTKLPMDDKGNLLFTEIRNYTDTADQGDDYLCSIDYGVYQGEAYILNVLYTKEAMEVTEEETAKMLHKDGVGDSDIESNNGGRGFARSVERILKLKFKSNRTRINPFHQSKNKKARILSNATWVMNHIYFPINWKDRFPEYYDAMIKYQKEGKNLHDDAPDATTGIAEKISQGSTFSFD
jgi:predicted phage terminase large subunit-like protein